MIVTLFLPFFRTRLTLSANGKLIVRPFFVGSRHVCLFVEAKDTLANDSCSAGIFNTTVENTNYFPRLKDESTR